MAWRRRQAVKIREDGKSRTRERKVGKAAARAAAQVDKFNASAAKATAQEMATQVNSLANELSRLSLPEAIERLPALLNLNAQALDAEVAAIRAETETKLGAAKTEEARNAALAEEADRVQKATVANELHAQKLVDTVTHTESAAKITEEYAKTIRGLQEAQDALKITVIDDQIKAITDSWKNLDIATRQSQLPQVLDLIEEKYDILAAKETAESEAKIANARASTTRRGCLCVDRIARRPRVHGGGAECAVGCDGCGPGKCGAFGGGSGVQVERRREGGS